MGDQERHSLHRAGVVIVGPAGGDRLDHGCRGGDRLEGLSKPEATDIGVAASVKEEVRIVSRPGTKRDDFVGEFGLGIHRHREYRAVIVEWSYEQASTWRPGPLVHASRPARKSGAARGLPRSLGPRLLLP